MESIYFIGGMLQQQHRIQCSECGCFVYSRDPSLCDACQKLERRRHRNRLSVHKHREKRRRERIMESSSVTSVSDTASEVSATTTV